MPAEYPTRARSDSPGRLLLVDGANVVGSRPDGWWRDRPGAARRLVEQLRAAVAAGRLAAPIVVVLEGAARAGVAAGEGGGVEVAPAAGSGDDRLVELVRCAPGLATVVTADRQLRDRCRAEGAALEGPAWLLDRLEAVGEADGEVDA